MFSKIKNFKAQCDKISDYEFHHRVLVWLVKTLPIFAIVSVFYITLRPYVVLGICIELAYILYILRIWNKSEDMRKIFEKLRGKDDV